MLLCFNIAVVLFGCVAWLGVVVIVILVVYYLIVVVDFRGGFLFIIVVACISVMCLALWV